MQEKSSIKEEEEEEDIDLDDLKIIIPKKIKTSCCKSYLTPKGRCYNCLEQPRKQRD